VQFRSLPAFGLERVDWDNRRINGVSLAQAVPALGHAVTLDGVTLDQIAAEGNVKKRGVKSRFTHPGLSSDGLGKHLGRIKDLRVEGDKVLGDLHLSELASKSPDGDLAAYVMGLAEEDPEAFGMSIVGSGRYVYLDEDGNEREEEDLEEKGVPEGVLPVLRLDTLSACDVVDEPAANRDGMFSASLWASNKMSEEAFGDIDGFLERYNVSPEKAQEFATKYFNARGVNEMAVEKQETVASNSTGSYTTNTIVFDEQEDSYNIEEIDDKMSSVDKKLAEMDAKLVAAQVENDLLRSTLSDAGKDAVRLSMRGRDYDELQDFIDAQAAVEAQFAKTVVSGLVPQDTSGVSGMYNSLDKIEMALTAMLDGTRPDKGVKPLDGIKELYTLLSGDWELTGMFQPQNIRFANVTTATMPQLVANALNKRVSHLFQTYDPWWEQLVEVQDFNNLHNVRWTKLGGIGELSTVTEGAAYQETSWSDDVETTGWTKRGQYLGLTLESVDKDDTQKLQLAPRALAQAAYLTLGKDFSRLFTVNTGTGAALTDTYKWFDSSNRTVSNLGTTALSLAQWKVITLAMMKQVELGSGERLGALTRPKYLVVPMDLENTAIEILGSPDVAASTQINVEAHGDTREARIANARSRVIVNPFWTDTNNYVAIADPKLWPAIGMGFRFGHVPEIFTAADPNSGLMFSNDTMPIKVRWFYSMGPISYNGVYKSNVT
jgi:hypothetical protein